MLVHCSVCNKSFEYEDNMRRCPFCGAPVAKRESAAQPQRRPNPTSGATSKTSESVSSRDMNYAVAQTIREILSRIFGIVSLVMIMFSLFTYFGQAYASDNSSLFNLAFHPNVKVPVGTDTVNKSYAGITVAFVALLLLTVFAIIALVSEVKGERNGSFYLAIVAALIIGVFLLIYLSVKSVDIYETKDVWGDVKNRVESRTAFGLGSVSLITSLTAGPVLGFVSRAIV